MKRRICMFLAVMGTDNFGRDILSRVLRGAGTTFIIAVVTIVCGALAGTIIGAVTSYIGGVTDEVIMVTYNRRFGRKLESAAMRSRRRWLLFPQMPM